MSTCVQLTSVARNRPRRLCGAQATKGEMSGNASVDGEAVTPAVHDEEEAEDDEFDWEKLNATEQKENHCYIHRVPAKLRNIDASRYDPSTVSIGPYHADKILEVSRANKKSYIRSLVARSGTPATDLRKMVNKVREKQYEARNYYAETVMLSEEDFIKMLVLDGCFILELFYKSLDELKEERVADTLYSKKWTHSSLRKDMALLENQIPYFVLIDLFEIAPKVSRPMQPSIHSPTRPSHIFYETSIQAQTPTQPSYPPPKYSLSELVLNFFSPLLPSSIERNKDKDLTGEDTRHLLDLLRVYVLYPPSENIITESSNWEYTTSATNLQDAGVRFKKKLSEKGLLDVTFENGTLEIPSFYFGKSWTVLFPNMIAREQCYGENDITSYAMLMDYLINTQEDVKLLRDNGIIRAAAEDAEIAGVVNSLCKEVSQENIHFDDLCHRLNKYRRNYCNTWRADFMKNYFNTPWRGASVVAAVLLLLLTIIQTVYAVVTFHSSQGNNGK